MTIRSLILGLAGALAVCSTAFFNDYVMRQSQLIPNQFPPVVYCFLILGVVGLMAGARLIARGVALTGMEWAVVISIILIACGIPGWGLIDNILPTAIMTHRYAKMEPGWKGGKVDVVETVPQGMLVDLSMDRDDRVLNGYIGGLGKGNSHIAIDDVPWAPWITSLRFWVPLILAFTVGSLGLAALVHRQWLIHENLPYPLTTFAQAILPEEDRPGPSVFYNRLFWVGSLASFLIYANNYLASWFNRTMISIPLSVNLNSLYDVLPWLGGQGYRYTFSFAIVGIAYFIRTNVAMSVGIVPYIFTFFALILTANGVSLTGGDHVGGNYNAFLFAGGYLGLFLLMLYTGRHYYRNALQQGLLFPIAEETPNPRKRNLRAIAIGLAVLGMGLLIFKAGVMLSLVGGIAAGTLHGWGAPRMAVKTPVNAQAVWGIRVFLISMLIFLALMVSVGLDWQLAVLFALIAVITVTAISRAVAETGALMFGTFFTPAPLILGFTGAVAMGPKAMLIMGLAGSALLLTPGWAPMSFMVQALSMAEMGKANVLKTAKWGVVVLAIGIPLSLGCALYWSYDRGAPTHSWPHIANQYPGRDLVGMSTKMEAQGVLKTSESLQGWERLGHLSPEWPKMLALGIIAGLTLLCGWLGLRFVWWPLHPVMFLFLGSFHGQWLSVSLLIGCGIKTGVIKYGGAAMHRRLKPLMIGFIGGSVVAATLPMIVGTIYYLATGDQPPRVPSIF